MEAHPQDLIKSVPCSLHHTEQIERVCLSPDSDHSLQCFECILKTKANSPQTQFSSLIDFITAAAQHYETNSRLFTLRGDPPSELVGFLVYEEVITKALADHIEREKQKVEKSFDFVIQELAQHCNNKKQEIFAKLDFQLSLLKQNYAEYKRRINKYFPKQNEGGNFDKASLIRKINLCKDVSEMERFIKDIKEDVSGPPENFSPKIQLQDFSYELNKQSNFMPKSIINNKEFLTKTLSRIQNVIEDFCEIKDPLIDISGNKLSFDSKIITEPQDTSLIKKWLSPFGKYVRLELLYRGSRDGFDPKIFHSKCDPYYSTLTIAKSKEKKTFGGFSDESWRVPNTTNYFYNNFVRSDNCWVFSLDHREKYPIKTRCKEAIYAHSDYGPTFGSGPHDLYLNLSANGTDCTSSLGISYECGWLNVAEKHNRLAGANKFTIKEIEVFAVFGHAPVLKDSKFDSKILDPVTDLKLIQDWTTKTGKASQGNNLELALIYRGSRDGFDAKAFHAYCDNQGPTLTVCKSAEYGKIFGGYTSQNWSKVNKFVEDSNAFLFSMTRRVKHLVKNSEKAIFCNEETGPIFGEGYDLFIAADGDKNEDSTSAFGVAYKARESSGDLTEYLAGAPKFRLEEIEVFRVITSFKCNSKGLGLSKDV